MNTDMSMFMVHSQCSWSTWSVFMVHMVSVNGPHGQCSWSTWSVFMVHMVSVHVLQVMVSVHGHDDMT